MDTSDFEAMERDGWADPEIANGYASGFELATKHVAMQLADVVRAGEKTSVLDLCCGHGVVASELVSRGADVTGLDFSAAMISLARAAVDGATFVQGDAMAMDFPDAHFQAVTVGFGVPHFPDPARGLSEVARVTKPGGRLGFSIWRGKGSVGAFGWLFDSVGQLADPTVKLPDGPDAHLLTDEGIANDMMNRAGFREVEITDVQSKFWVSKPEDLFDVFDQGAVRAAALLRGQSNAVRDEIRADLAHRVVTDGVANEGGYVVLAPSVVISGTKA